MDKVVTAEYSRSIGGNRVQCLLCPHRCLIDEGKLGFCNGRENVQGRLIAANYGYSIGIGLDPIEKKPLYHFRPGTKILSTGANSCNFDCFYCQNFDASRSKCPTRYIDPQRLAEMVDQQEVKQIAFTYTEPFTWIEYIMAFSNISPHTDIVLVTNGFIEEDPLNALLEKTTAMNIDLKGSTEDFYQQYCKGRLAPVLKTIKLVWEAGIHLELSYLIIPGLNDSADHIERAIDLIAGISDSIPVHFSAYHPSYRCVVHATEPEAILSACRSAKRTLKYVYAGNIGTNEFSHTHCHECGEEVIRRSPQGMESQLSGNKCYYCNSILYGVFI